MKKGYLLITLLSLTLLSIGCALSSPSPTPDDTNTLATMVAMTVEGALGEPTFTPAPSENPATQVSVGDAPATAIPQISTEASVPTPPPPVSPSALTVAYVKNSNVYVWVEGGSSTQLTYSGDAASVYISDDGQIIAYIREIPAGSFAFELWAVNTSIPTNERLLISHAEMDALKAISSFPEAVGLGFSQVTWKPNTHQLAYGTVPRFEGSGYVPGEDIRMVNADTLEKTILLDFGQGGEFSFSPKGTQIVFSTPDHIGLVNADGNNLHPSVLTFPIIGTYSEYNYHPSPVWASDSASLRVVIPPEDTLADPISPSNLWLIHIDGSPASLLGSIPAVPFDWPDTAYSPNFARVAYVKSIGVPSDNQRELHLANEHGSEDIIYAAGTSIHFEGWTPDSTRFVYSFYGESDKSLYLANRGDGAFTITSDRNTLSQMRWVDASRFLYLSQSGTNWELRISDVDGTNHAFIDTLAERYNSFDFTQ